MAGSDIARQADAYHLEDGLEHEEHEVAETGMTGMRRGGDGDELVGRGVVVIPLAHGGGRGEDSHIRLNADGRWGRLKPEGMGEIEAKVWMLWMHREHWMG